MAKREISFHGKAYHISYELLHSKCEQTIVFLHGWGSNKELMKIAFGKTFDAFQHLYIDLPGFGQSSIEEVLETKDYQAIVKLFLEALHVTPFMIVGHSFGGKVATLLKPARLVLLSTAGIVVEKSLKVKTKIALFKLFKPFAPKRFYRFFATKDVEGMSERMYQVVKRVVDEDFSLFFAQTSSKTWIFWGKDDKATPVSSGERIHALIQKSTFYPLEGDHFFFLKQASFIEQTVLETLA